MTAAIAPDTIAQHLNDPSTCLGALRHLEDLRAHEAALAHAAAQALCELMTRDATEVAHSVFQRAGFALGHLFLLAPPDEVASLFGAAFGDGRLVAMLNSRNVVSAATAKPSVELRREDVLSYCAMHAFIPQTHVRGWSQPWMAAGFVDVNDYFRQVYLNADPMISKKRQHDDDVPLRACALMLEILRSQDVPAVAHGVAWVGVCNLLNRPTVAHVVDGICNLAVSHLRAAGSPTDWLVRLTL